jgi:ribosomal protein S12 methylthiotransferase
MTITTLPSPPKVGMVSLGCPKNLVDSERILSKLRADGYHMSADYAGADVVLVNTCGFLDSAKEESLEAIGEAIAENGRVVVTGCMGREAEVIRERFPDVLAITGAHQYEAVVAAVHAAAPTTPSAYLDLVPQADPGNSAGLKLTPRHYSYLKISEGCNHRCAFCIIPQIRGDLVSRRPDAILREAEKLVAQGTRELLVISQDTSAYGLDLKHGSWPWKGQPVRAHMTDLAAELGRLGAWVRLHYVYPYPHVDRVIPLMAEGLVLPYLDIPFQHASPKVLKAMKRPANEERYARLMELTARISAEKLAAKVGRTLDVIVDAVDSDTGGATARSKADAPEIDGEVQLRDAGHLAPGDIVPVLIEDSDEHDLYGAPLSVAAAA